MTHVDTVRFGAATAGSAPPAAPPPPTAAPSVRRRRRTLLLTLLVLILTAGGIVGGRFWADHNNHQVWALTTGLAAGATIQPGQVQRLTVSGDAARALMPTTVPVVGQVLNRSVPAGAGLPRAALGGVQRFPAAGEELLGVALPSGDAPAAVQPGSLVTVLELPPSTNGQQPPAASSLVVLPQVEVVATTPANGGMVATLRVPIRFVPELTALSAQQRVAVALSGSGP